MPPSDSVTTWIGQLRAGEQAAAQKLWERYYRRLVGLARGMLRHAPGRAADEEDVALSAFASFCRGVERGRFPQLVDRDNLWRLLVTIAARKALRHLHRDRLPRAGRSPAAEQAFDDGSGDSDLLDQIVGPEPTPAFAAEVAEECQRLLACLEDAQLRSLAILKLEGYSTQEIAAKLGCVPRTVQRRLRLIRGIWEQEVAP